MSLQLSDGTPAIPVRYVQVKVFCTLTGYSDVAVARKIESGEWAEGREYRVAPDRHVLMDLRELALPTPLDLGPCTGVRISAPRLVLEQRAAKVAHASLRALRCARQMPAWADRERIEAIYAEAARLTQETGIEHHVDHEVPLRAKLASGLHCEFNLRVITAAENLRKKNRFEP